AAGNTTASGQRVYSYDFEDHLVSLNTNEVVLEYDGQGKLTSRRVGNTATAYLIDEDNPTGYAQIVEERVGGSLTKALVFGSQLVSQRQKSNGNWTRSFYVYDGHGDVRLLADENGVVSDAYDYDAFG